MTGDPESRTGHGAHRGPGPGRPEILVRVVGAGTVLVVASLAARSGVTRGERRVFEALNGGPRWLAHVLWLPMQLGSLWGPFVVAGLTWRRLRSRTLSLGSVVAGVVAWQLAKLVKAIVERGRPGDLLEDVARMPGTPREGLGFVSGHAAVAFSLVAVLSPHLSRRQRVRAYALAALVAVARIQVSAHMPWDAVGGAALGYGTGWGWNLAVGAGDHA